MSNIFNEILNALSEDPETVFNSVGTWEGYCDRVSWDAKPKCGRQCDCCKDFPVNMMPIADMAGEEHRKGGKMEGALLKTLYENS